MVKVNADMAAARRRAGMAHRAPPDPALSRDRQLLNEALDDLGFALDAIEEAQWSKPGFTCPWCGGCALHTATCKPARLLQSYGRHVDIWEGF